MTPAHRQWQLIAAATIHAELFVVPSTGEARNKAGKKEDSPHEKQKLTNHWIYSLNSFRQLKHN